MFFASCFILDLLQKSSSHRATADIGQMQHRLTQMVSWYFRIFVRGLFYNAVRICEPSFWLLPLFIERIRRKKEEVIRVIA
jgi:hypothetical protein